MRYRILAAVALAGFTGCVETDSPTEPLLEQRVFTALGGLDVGESLSPSGPSAQQILLGGSPVESEFVIIPFHASRALGGEVLLEITGSGVGARADAVSPARTTVRPEHRQRIANWELHESMQERFRTAVNPVLRSFRQTSGASQARSLEVSRQLSGSDLQVGAIVELNTDVRGAPCVGVDLRTARVEAISDHAVIVADLGNPEGGFNRSDYESFAAEFDELVHPTIVDVFGPATDIDENGRVVIFFTRAVNELTRPSDEGFVAGFFYARDLFPNSGADPCVASNAGEMFYILVPDPGAVASHIPHQRNDVFRGALGTIGHEYQHLINASRRIWVNDASSLEETWLNEGLSHIAEELLFYAAADITPRSNVSEEHLDSPRLLTAINQFGVENLVRYGLYLDRVTDASPSDRVDALATRGAAWALLRYIGDHHTGQTDLELYRALANAQAVGYQNLARVLQEDPLEWVRRWGISVYADDFVTALAEVPEYQQPSWNFRSLLPLLFNVFPLEVRALAGSSGLAFDLRSGTSGYVKFTSRRGEATQIEITSNDQPPPDDLRVTVIRTE